MPVPKLGEAITVGGRSYTLLATEPYIRKGDSLPSTLLTWQGVCAICGTLYVAKTGPTSVRPAVRCRPCANAGAVTPAQAAARDAFGQRVREAAAKVRAARGAKPRLRFSAPHVQDARLERAEAAGLNVNREDVERWIVYGGTMPSVTKIT